MKWSKLFYIVVGFIWAVVVNNSSIISVQAQSVHSWHDNSDYNQYWERAEFSNDYENFSYSEVHSYREDWNSVWNQYESLAKLFHNETLLEIVTRAKELELTDENITSFMVADADLKPLLDALDNLNEQVTVKPLSFFGMPTYCTWPFHVKNPYYCTH